MATQKRRFPQKDYPHSELTGEIIRAAHIVHRSLGPGFREVIYQRALKTELTLREIESEREVEMDVYFKGMRVGKMRVDFVIGDVLVEIKAKTQSSGLYLSDPHP